MLKFGPKSSEIVCKFMQLLLDNSNATFAIESTQQFQQIIGFGGAFTDATGINGDEHAVKRSTKLD